MTTQNSEVGAQPLTTLSEDERLFRDSVYEFADREIRPLVREMDEHAKIAPALVDKLFDLGVMGIEIPDSYGGGGASFFHSVLAVEALSRVDPSIGVLVDVQNTLVINALIALGHTRTSGQRYLPKMAADTIGAYALSEAGSGSDAFALTTRAVERDGEWVLTGRKLWITNGNEANLFIVFANVNPEAGYRGITAFLVERGFPGFTVGKKEDKLGIRASSTCELLFDGCRVPPRERARRGRQGLQGGDRDAQRGADRHRRPDDRPRARGARSRDRATRESASSSASRSPSSRRSSTRSRARRPSSRRRGCSSTMPRGCATRDSRFSPKRRCARSSRRRSPSASPRWPSTCSAATAS